MLLHSTVFVDPDLATLVSEWVSNCQCMYYSLIVINSPRWPSCSECHMNANLFNQTETSLIQAFESAANYNIQRTSHCRALYCALGGHAGGGRGGTADSQLSVPLYQGSNFVSPQIVSIWVYWCIVAVGTQHILVRGCIRGRPVYQPGLGLWSIIHLSPPWL